MVKRQREATICKSETGIFQESRTYIVDEFRNTCT